MLKQLRNFGAIFAGFELALKLVGFFGIGALAKWVIEEWVPFTRWVWTWVLDYIHLPDLDPAEKDALTTVAFFAPLGLWSAIWYFTADHGEVTRKYSRLLAFSFGVIFFVIVGRNLIVDVLSANVLPFGISAQVLLITINVLTVAAILVQMSFSTMSGLVSSIGGEDAGGKGADQAGTWARNISFAIMAVVAVFYLTLLIVNGPQALGWIRLASFLLVIVFLALTIWFDPERMSVVFGALIAFVLTSLAYDLLMLVSRFIQDAPDA